ncbi:MAG: hypothetical protein ABIK65_10590 [Candidatus Eisenbacteria bacterium]
MASGGAIRFFLSMLLVALLAAPPAHALPRAREKWIEVRTENFFLFSDAREKDVREIGLNLERLRFCLQVMFRTMRVNSPHPTYIYVFKDNDSFRRYIESVDPDYPTLGAFLERSDGNYVVVDRRAGLASTRVVYHEYLHYFVHNNVNVPLPVWLDEGLADYYSSFQVEGNELDAGMPLPWAISLLRAESPMPLESLFEVDRSSPVYHGGKERGVFYAQSWALTHLLLTQPDREKKVARFLELLHEGKPATASICEAFQVSRGASRRPWRSIYGSPVTSTSRSPSTTSRSRRRRPSGR